MRRLQPSNVAAACSDTAPALAALQLWNTSEGRELIGRVDAAFLPHWDSYGKPVQKADALRYYIMKHVGGKQGGEEGTALWPRALQRSRRHPLRTINTAKSGAQLLSEFTGPAALLRDVPGCGH